ncbi:MAG: right-handed parallel beta-helix repeat-containing protein [Candidatus Cloacimonetes bacterium]|nr:right-handed parallel beta-helix repeat-containing protein [Candidatus Cloacimonadota bacterium]
MKKLILLIFIISGIFLQAMSLQQAYELAQSQGIYDRYLILETGVIYTGGLLIGKTLNPLSNTLEGQEGENVFIDGNGAILDLQQTELTISYCQNRLDIQDCIIINGDVHFRGESQLFQAKPEGSISYCTFYNNDDYGFRFMGTGDGVELNHNIFADALETGDDYTYLTGFSMEWIPTGINVAISGQGGYPDIHDNWSWFSDEETNQDSLFHFAVLCDYG